MAEPYRIPGVYLNIPDRATTVGALMCGESGLVPPDAMKVDGRREGWIGGHTPLLGPHPDAALEVTRTKDGLTVEARLPGEHLWTPDDTLNPQGAGDWIGVTHFRRVT
jgi:hypothetical protein